MTALSHRGRDATSRPRIHGGGARQANPTVVPHLYLSAYLKTRPALFYPIAAMRQSHKRRLVHRDTGIVIEGFQRCGNHFATYAFELAQRVPVETAHHFHAPAQIMLAHRWRIPAILLIREPRDAVASYMVYLGLADPRPLLRLYNLFYSSLVPYRNSLVVADFDTVVSDFGSVIAETNRRFGTAFDRFEQSAENADRVNERIRLENANHMSGAIDQLPLPDARKDGHTSLAREALAAPRAESLVRKAEAVYREVRSWSPA